MTNTVQGIEYAIQHHPQDSCWVGHCWVQDETSGTVFGIVGQGPTPEALRTNIVELLCDSRDYCREAIGVPEPRLVGKGWDPKNPPTARK